MIRSFLLLLLATGAHLPASTDARDADGRTAWHTRIWTTEDGLPTNTVAGIVQADDGFLWINNPARLVRFDGVQFEEAPKHTYAAHPRQRVQSIRRARGNGLWVEMEQGRYLLCRDGRLQELPEGLPATGARFLMEQEDGTLWLAHDDGGVYRHSQGSVRHFDQQDGLPSGGLQSFLADREGRVWFGRQGQVGCWNGSRFETLQQLARQSTRLAPASDGGLWMAVGSGLFKCRSHTDSKPAELGRLRPDRAEVEPSCLMEDPTGAVWIGTQHDGLFRYSAGDGFEAVPTSHRGIRCLATDREGNLWVGTNGGGLNRIRPRAITLHSRDTGLAYDTVRSLGEDTEGALWAVTENRLVLRRRQGHPWEDLTAAPDWPGGMPTCITGDRTGGVWIGTSSRSLLHRKNGRYRVWRNEDGLSGHTTRALCTSRSGALWIAQNGPSSLQRLDGDGFVTHPLPDTLGTIQALVEDTAGAVWLGSSGGLLLRVQDGRLTDETSHTANPRLAILCLAPQDDGSLWIGYAGGGIGRLKNGLFTRITAMQGLPENRLCQILTDDRGWCWLAGDLGIAKVQRTELERALADAGHRVWPIRFGSASGLPSLQANYGYSPHFLHGSDGRLWMPMRTALVSVSPWRLGDDTPPPVALLHRIDADRRTLAHRGWLLPSRDFATLGAGDSALTLPPDHQRLEFHYTAISLSSPESVRYRYRLEGLDTDWIEAGKQRVAEYSRLPAGRYVFRVLACNSRGIWGASVGGASILVRPFFWQTWWFRVGALTFFTALVAGVVWWSSVRRLRRELELVQRQSALDKERARIARDIHDDVGNQLTEIVLLTGLAQRERGDAERGAALVRQISTATRQVIKALDEAVWAINPRNDTLPHLVSYLGQYATSLLAAAGMRCRLSLPDHPPAVGLAADVRHNLFLAAKEALTNAARHSGASEVELRIEIADGELRIAIGDDGSGFPPDTPDNSGQRDGIRNMRQRVLESGGTFELSTAPGAGTRILIRHPLDLPVRGGRIHTFDTGEGGSRRGG